MTLTQGTPSPSIPLSGSIARCNSFFRDPSGYVFTEKGQIRRMIRPLYFREFDHLEKSGLYKELVDWGLLIPHTLLDRSAEGITIAPQRVPLITYPSEWSFEALKGAALLHLKINVVAMDFNMILKDATAYNVQFIGSAPIFIDTLSFDFYKEDHPWDAFGQFCRHFIAPLLLMKYRSLDFNRVLTSFIDGIPVDMASSLLPKRTHLGLFIKSNIHMHAKSIRRNQEDSSSFKKTAKLSKKGLLNIFRYTSSFLEGLHYPKKQSEWGQYYDSTNYSEEAFKEKDNRVRSWIEEIQASRIWDAGGNDGHFSRSIAPGKELVVTSDIDPVAVDRSFMLSKEVGLGKNILSLLIDLANPTPSFGFTNTERTSFIERIRATSFDCSLALALIHHLCISNGLSFPMVAGLFASLSTHLIIEFVDRRDDRVERILGNMRGRRSLFDFYTRENFEKDFSSVFTIKDTLAIPQSFRVLYLMESKKLLPTI